MTDNLPQDFRDVEQNTVVGEDSRSLELTHYVLAERLIQVEYAGIQQEIRQGEVSDTLIYMLEGGLRGYHKMTGGELWAEWKAGAEDRWYQLYEDGELAWEPYDEDPILRLEQDENGEVEHA